VKYKIPKCEECGGILKGRVPIATKVICFFCRNPPFDDNGEENTALKQTDKR
jgi:hypothetical protein